MSGKACPFKKAELPTASHPARSSPLYMCRKGMPGIEEQALNPDMGMWVLAQYLSLTSFMSLPNICVLWLVLWTSRKGNCCCFGCEASCQALCKSNSIYGWPWVKAVFSEFRCFFFVFFLFICFVFAIHESARPEDYQTMHIVSNSFSILLFLLFSLSVMSDYLR